MASLTSDLNGYRRIVYVDGNGDRKTIHLGKVTKRDGETFRTRVEALLSAQFCGTSPDRETSLWVASLPPKIKRKLAKHQLIAGVDTSAKESTAPTVQAFCARYLDTCGENKKPSTRLNWRQATDCLVDFLPNNLRIDELNAGQVRDWVESMRKTLAATTTHKRFTICRQVFAYAVDHKELADNPFDSLKLKKPRTKVNVEVPRETVDKLLKQCTPKWAAIIALSRYGGLRCPSEVLSLKWEHVDLENGILSIPEPKMEHHEGRGLRKCPLFPEVRAALEKLPNRGGYVIDENLHNACMTKDGWKNANLRSVLMDLLGRAQIKPWPRLFHSMRASRQTEIEQEFGLPAACAWLGNTESVAKESYLLVFADTWKRATGKTDAQSNAQPVQNDKKPTKTEKPKPRKTTKKPANPGETRVS